jgi:acyl-coenzyme A thioesterase PaaI-like protein
MMDALFLRFLSEDTEVYAAVGSVLHEVGVGREVMVFAMLEHEDAAIAEQLLFEDKVRNGGKLFQGVGRIGKDEVELLSAALQETEHVAPQGHASLSVEFLQAVADETVMVAVGLYADHAAAPS